MEGFSSRLFGDCPLPSQVVSLRLLSKSFFPIELVRIKNSRGTEVRSKTNQLVVFACLAFQLSALWAQDCRNTRMSCQARDAPEPGGTTCCMNNLGELRCGTCAAAGGCRDKDCNTWTGHRCGTQVKYVMGVCDETDVLGGCAADVPDSACNWGWCECDG